MKEVIIHAGLHKTGSTSIQRSLFFNQQILKRNGYQFLDVIKPDKRKLKNHSSAIINLFRDNPEDHYLNKINDWDAIEVKEFYCNQLDSAIEKLGEKKLLISGEGISSLNEDGLERLKDYFKGFNIRIFVYVRDPYEAMCYRLQDVITNGVKRPLAKLSPEHSRIHKASIMIEAFKNVFPDTEFYSFDESLQQGGPVNKFFNILGISDLNDLNEYRNNKGLSNKLARLGEYINNIEPFRVNDKTNPFRSYFRLKDLEFGNDKFYLTKQEALRFIDFISSEKQKIKSMTGIEFNAEMRFSGDPGLTLEEVETVIEKSVGMNAWMKILIWEYIEANSDASRNEKKRFFSSDDDLMDADILRDTAIMWEKKDLDRAYQFMKLAKLIRPDGVRINEKLDEYRKKLKISDTD